MKVRTNTYSRTTASCDDGEFNLDHEPVFGDVELKIVGDRAAVGYLVYDSVCENPMTSNDCMGEFITEDSRSDSPWGHLGLLEKPYRGEIIRDLEVDGVHEYAMKTLAEHLIEDQDFLDFCEENYERTTEEDKCDMAFAEACLSQIDFQYDIEVPAWLEEKYEFACEAAWDILFEEGKIGTHLAVPCRWNESVHGPGTAEAYPCSVDECNAVWIPTKDDLDNIVKPGATHAENYAAAVKYATGCLDEFSKYCNGECFGIVVETFQKKWVDNWNQEWNLVESDHCWGHIGHRYAEESLKDLFQYHCNAFLKETA